MRLGFALPQIGPAAGPDALVAVAKRAEELGYDNLWVLDRLLYPTDPQAPYPVGDGILPTLYKTVLDPLETLTYVAAHTTRVGLGTSILNLPWYNPVLLARRLTTLDVLSGGRLRVGLGVGWSPDEYEAAGVPWQGRGKRADEALQVLKAIWTTDPVEFDGEYYHLPRSYIGPKPVQRPHPPIYMAAYVPSAMQRVAQHADGWFPVGIPLAAVPQMFDQIKGMAEAAGRDPASLEIVARANVEFSDAPPSGERADYTGTLEQIAADIAATREMGATELVIDVGFAPGVDTEDAFLTRLEQIWQHAQPA